MTVGAAHQLVAVTRQAFDAAACSLAVIDAPAEELVYLAADGAGAAEIRNVRLAVDRGIAGFVAVSGQALSVDDVDRDARFARDVAERTGYVPRSLLAAPVSHDDDVVAVLTVLDPDRHRDPLARLELLAGFAALATDAVIDAVRDAPTGPTDAALRRMASLDTEAQRLVIDVVDSVVRYTAARR